MSCHSTVKTFKCESCEFACKSNFGLQTHKMHKHTPTKVTCQNCLRTFVNQEKCDKHKCQLKIVICPICGIQLGHNNKVAHFIARFSSLTDVMLESGTLNWILNCTVCL
ncbi:hypothetical protein evm_014709 [Chilo suppressalis]|nr:hypothetical protein evm_014709 [Chilo suppressalis]